jgi:uncharacterized membrane protein YsdA (DUF1294 family)
MDQEQIILIGYFAFINIIAFINIGLDKWKAKSGRWRTSEWHLMVPGILGGILGVLAGMKFFRHKTRKTSFQIPIVGIIILNIVYWYLFYHFYLA